MTVGVAQRGAPLKLPLVKTAEVRGALAVDQSPATPLSSIRTMNDEEVTCATIGSVSKALVSPGGESHRERVAQSAYLPARMVGAGWAVWLERFPVRH